MSIEHTIGIQGADRAMGPAGRQSSVMRGSFSAPAGLERDVLRERARTRMIRVFNPPINGSEVHGAAVDDSEASFLNVEANDGTERHIPIAAGR